MADINDAFVTLWRSVNSSIPYNPDAAIVKEWRRRHQEWGSPVSKETPMDAGGVFQVFSHAIVQWTPERGVEVVTEE